MKKILSPCEPQVTAALSTLFNPEHEKQKPTTNADRIKEIIRLEKEAQECDDKIAELSTLASALKWKAAEKIWEESQSGTKNVEIAHAIKKSPMHVTYMKRCWELNLSLAPGETRPLFNETYNSAYVRASRRKKKLTGEDLDTSGFIPESEMEKAWSINYNNLFEGTKYLFDGFKAIEAKIGKNADIEGLIKGADSALETLTEILHKLEEYQKSHPG